MSEQKMIYAHMGTGDESCFNGQVPPLANPLPKPEEPRQFIDRPKPNPEQAPKHNHYYRFVSDLQKMDWYRFCERFDVIHPCAQHAGKKIVFAGQRGAKDIDKDIQEAIDTLVRWQEMRKEAK